MGEWRVIALISTTLAGCTPTVDDSFSFDDDDATLSSSAELDVGEEVRCDAPGDGRFTDITVTAGLSRLPAMAAFYSPFESFDSSMMGHSSTDIENQGGLAVHDFDGDGALDIAYVEVGGEPVLYRGDGALGFSPYSIPSVGSHNTSISAVDIEGDGDTDLYIGRPGDNVLLLNTPDGWRDATADWRLAGGGSQTLTASWADFDRDGDLDVYLADYGQGSMGPEMPSIAAPDLLLRQEGGAFNPVQGVLPDPDRIGFSYVGAWFDADDDGWLDLYIVTDLGGEDPQFLPNHLLMNRGGTLEPAPDLGLDVPMFAMGVAVGDMDGDGDPDVHVSNAGTSFLARNDGGEFVDISLSIAALSNRPQGDISWGTDFVDVDNDGRSELFTAFGYMPTKGPTGGPQGTANSPLQRDSLWRWRPDSGSYEDIAPGLGLDDIAWSRTVIPADFDRDGTPELLTWSLDRGLTLNHAACSDRAWLRVSLRGAGSNVDAIGARVTAWIGDRPVVGQITNGSTGSMASRPPEVLLGLGDVETTTLEVRWPDGVVTRNEGVPTRRGVVLTEP